LGPKYDSFPADLSGGEKQRVAIARAVATEPQVILADEPTAALDSHSGRFVMEMLRELAHRQGRAVVVVTHDNRVLEYGDRVVRIEDGRISSGSTEPAPLDDSSVTSNQPSVVSFQ
jgi:putative ABC transport system ATP-binding protein